MSVYTFLIIFSNVCKQYNVLVLSDEIYARLKFDNNHVSMANVSIPNSEREWVHFQGKQLCQKCLPPFRKWICSKRNGYAPVWSIVFLL